MSKVLEVFDKFHGGTFTEHPSHLVISDLCESTPMLVKKFKAGVGLQAAHEQLCSEVSGVPPADPKFKSMGDGVWMQIDDAFQACRNALAIIDEASRLRTRAEAGEGHPAFKDFHLKVVVASGRFIRARGSQRWLGMLPAKAARISTFARKDEVWIDDAVAGAIAHLLTDLNAEFGPDPGKGAAFYIPLKGLEPALVMIRQLRRKGSHPGLTEEDEQAKIWLLPWSDVMARLKEIVKKVEGSGLKPSRVVGIGRSGAILGGIIAGNLRAEGGHIPIDVVERTHIGKNDPRRVISTITEPKETYRDFDLDPDDTSEEPREVWESGPILLVIGEAKTGRSFNSAIAWLNRRGASDIRTVALVKSKATTVDFYSLEAENALLPWQFVSGYDHAWPTFAKG
jgi:hypoxanthine phosphoribosyltransferase